ncbi:hypothetical protein [Micromonospora sp. NBC_01813]|uniref:hypothetical protein n=1 Tax=Micromonospora sp. NBC_01813 TaxID=2975988 RepID=UPI002DDA782C|nr:hypothetical protein [Micromonospora sp. NBC_01813]WSA06504.1 hypothetical protein OG958_19600 [Micromonospora sp. NBC_01813]
MTDPYAAAVVVACGECRGTAASGADGRPCGHCDGFGRRRAQLVLSVANVDTGAVVSASVVPGTVAATPTGCGDFWCLDLAGLLGELAAAAGIAQLYDPQAPDDPVLAPWLQLPKPWRPDLPADQRYALEAQAIAAESIDPWRLWLGRTPAPPGGTHPPSPATVIAVALRLGLTVTVGGIEVGGLRPAATVDRAVADCFGSLPDALGDLIPADPGILIPVPFERRPHDRGRLQLPRKVDELLSIDRDWTGIVDVDTA